MPNKHDLEQRFIAHLRRLHADDDRAALAHLRRGLGKPPGSVVGMYRLVQPWLPDNLPQRREDVFYLVAALFAAHPEPGGHGDLGGNFAKLAAKRDSESIEKRFVAIVNSHEDELPNHLRHAMSLLAADSIPVDWVQLLLDLQRWTHPERFVQRRWARSHWSTSPSKE